MCHSTQQMEHCAALLPERICPESELIVEKFPGEYDARMLNPEAYRTLGIGVRSLQAAGPLANLVISYLKESVR